MKRIGKPVFFIVFVLILFLTYTSVFGIYGENGDFNVTYIKGINDIRWGIDIKGGVEAVFAPASSQKSDTETVKQDSAVEQTSSESDEKSVTEGSEVKDDSAEGSVQESSSAEASAVKTEAVKLSEEDDKKITDDQMQAVKSIIDLRLVSSNVTDYELYPDYAKHRITVRFPWKSDEKDFDPLKALNELASTAKLTFRPGNSYSETSFSDNGDVIYKTPTGETASTVLMDGSGIARAYVSTDTDPSSKNYGQYVVALELNDIGTEQFKEATTTYKDQVISIWMDDQMISAPTVDAVITNGKCTISGKFDAQSATDLANKINAGALPFDLTIESYGTISPSLGTYALQAMGIAALAALCFIFLFMCIIYRVPGFIAFIALMGQLSISIMAVSGYFTVFPSFTMTIPGIAGMILSIGMGVDANIITAERIKDELWSGKTLDGCIANGTKGSLSAIIDGNITIIIVAVILILVFGPANIFSSIFGISTTGLIYAFGYTLLMGVIANFIMGVGASRLMLRSVSGLRFLRNKRLYGGKKKS